MEDSDVALALLQLVALVVPPIAVLIQMLRQSGNLPWRTRKVSFAMALGSVVAFIAAGATVILYVLTATAVAPMLRIGMGLVVLGIIPFALFTVVLYREHKAQFGP